MKANHNADSNEGGSASVVYQIKDTIFWKQITTYSTRWNKLKKLFIRSKIQFFESKSQLIISNYIFQPCCLSDQRYNFLKANHNVPFKPSPKTSVVYQIKDTIFWKQITTWQSLLSGMMLLFIRSKIQFFESKSQLLGCLRGRNTRCLSDQRYIPIFIGIESITQKKARCKPRFKCFHNGIILIVICFKNCTANILHLFQNKSFFS